MSRTASAAACLAALLVSMTSGCGGSNPIADKQVSTADLNATKAHVTADSQNVANTLGRHGSIFFLKGHWQGCDDVDYRYLQYVVQGRLDIPVGTGRPVTPTLVTDLKAAGWSGNYDRGTSNQSTVGLDKGNVGVELAENTSDQMIIFHLTGPCQKATKALADQLLVQQVTDVPHA